MRTPTSSFTSLESAKYSQEVKRLKKKKSPRAQFPRLYNGDTEDAALWG